MWFFYGLIILNLLLGIPSLVIDERLRKQVWDDTKKFPREISYAVLTVVKWVIGLFFTATVGGLLAGFLVVIERQSIKKMVAMREKERRIEEKALEPIGRE